MKIHVSENPEALGRYAADLATAALRKAIAKKGGARLMLSTGASQFETLSALVAADIDWAKVEMFHLDEYVGLDENHPASFRRYLKERFTSRVPLAAAHFVDGGGDTETTLRNLSGRILRSPIDLGLIGIGENAHIAFNDPPADFETEAPFIVVALDEACKRQQVREGWFPDPDAVPRQAITASVRQIMKIEKIVSCVPHKVKAEAIRRTLSEEIGPRTPASILRTHPDMTLCLDRESASLIPEELRSTYAI